MNNRRDEILRCAGAKIGRPRRNACRIANGNYRLHFSRLIDAPAILYSRFVIPLSVIRMTVPRSYLLYRILLLFSQIPLPRYSMPPPATPCLHTQPITCLRTTALDMCRARYHQNVRQFPLALQIDALYRRRAHRLNPYHRQPIIRPRLSTIVSVVCISFPSRGGGCLIRRARRAKRRIAAPTPSNLPGLKYN